ncbi:MAG: glycoside hydrolase, partial [Gemmatimonadales bacterium]|nr:glycoside hydrolase [Gemmatimonadales bacterium]
MPLPFRVIPQPREVRPLPGPGIAFGDLGRVHLGKGVRRPAMGPILALLPLAGGGAKGVLRLALSEAASLPDTAEGYRLRIANGNVRIAARGAAGLFYGCQTLEQLLEDARDTGVSVPACEIVDYPALATRAVHIDVKHHLDTMEYYYDAVDRLARYKINAIIFEFEDKLRYRRRPLVGGPLAILIEEMAALTRYARERHIDISPL